jgi:AcrR family transcriptional regulator
MTAKTLKRGRPAKISLEDIVAKAIEQLSEAPDKPLSMNALAKALDVTPMALYRYVQDRDHLLQAVANQMLSHLAPEIPDAHGSQQLRAWSLAVRDYFLANPGLFGLLGWNEHIATAWWEQLATLTRILKAAGLTHQSLADSVQWVGNSIMGSIYLEIAGQQSGFRLNDNDWQSLSQDDAIAVEDLITHLNRKNARTVFTDGVERIIANIQASTSHD